jgi:uncharacterized protein (DUF2062 family)
MFRRRVPLSWQARLREIILPRKGFSRLYSYMAQRVLRMPGTPYSLAAGFACGVCVSFTPLIGFHLILAAVLAYVMRANMIAAWAGTIVGNPWTFPLIFILLHEIGSFIIFNTGLEGGLSIAGNHFYYAQFMQHFFPLVVGGMVMVVPSWLISFALAHWAVVSWRKHRLRRLTAKKQMRENKNAL